jgi:hypothetical protein
MQQRFMSNDSGTRNGVRRHNSYGAVQELAFQYLAMEGTDISDEDQSTTLR